LLEWDAVPGSVGVQLRVDLPSGTVLNRRIIGPERDQFAVPDALLTLGTYVWRVQAACSTIPPFYDATPISAPNTFVVSGPSTCPATVSDVDGNVYSAVEIGSQCWMKENLKVERYLNGDAIPTGLSSAAWQATTDGAFAIYNNVASNKAIYGLLYNWYAVADARGLCPTGWHVPIDGEWTQLTDLFGGQSVAGGQMKTTGTLSAGTGLWLSPNTAATNSSGFSGIPGNFRSSSGDYPFPGLRGDWWSLSESSTNDAWMRRLFYNNGEVAHAEFTKNWGFSVRCLRD